MGGKVAEAGMHLSLAPDVSLPFRQRNWDISLGYFIPILSRPGLFPCGNSESSNWSMLTGRLSPCPSLWLCLDSGGSIPKGRSVDSGEHSQESGLGRAP